MDVMEYYQHEPHEDPVRIQADLVSFVYDVPYLGACGIFPPLHILNELLATGGGDGGMGPGASWQPFSLTEAEYQSLWQRIEATDPTTLAARYHQVKFRRDPAFEQVSDHLAWAHQVCSKHRDAFLEAQEQAFRNSSAESGREDE